MGAGVARPPHRCALPSASCADHRLRHERRDACRVVELNGIHINYEEHGSHYGTPILLTHAYAATLQMWKPAVRGAGATTASSAGTCAATAAPTARRAQDDYTEKLTVEDMAALLRHLGIQQAVIGGLSLGGYISLEFQLAHPEMVRALILCNTGPGYRKDEARAGWNDFSIGYAKRFEERGLDGLGRGIEIDATRQYQRSARGPRVRRRAASSRSATRRSWSTSSRSTCRRCSSSAPTTSATRPAASTWPSKIPNARKVVIERRGPRRQPLPARAVQRRRARSSCKRQRHLI